MSEQEKLSVEESDQCRRKNWSLRTQLLTTFGSLAAIVGGITLALCLGILYSTGDTSEQQARHIILDQSDQTAANLAQEIAATTEEQFLIVGRSVNFRSAKFAATLLTTTDATSSSADLPYAKLSPVPSFREYNFQHGCVYPSCPEDYATIYTRSRLPEIAGYEEGSAEYSSLYLFSSAAQSGLRTEEAWSSAFAAMPSLQTVQDALALQDLESPSLYFDGPNTTVMFYISTKLRTSSASNAPYYSLHRTFPGIQKDDAAYNPPLRSWFQPATSRGLLLSGPYQETFTKQLVVTLSTKQSITVNSLPVDIVIAAVMLLQSIQDIVQSASYPYYGFGALVTTSSQNVLAWGSRTDLFDNSTKTFRTISDIDPSFPTNECVRLDGVSNTFKYSDSKDRKWIVSCKSLLKTYSSNSGGGVVAGDTLTMIVFFDQSAVEEPLHFLYDEVDSTTSKVTADTLIIVLCTIGGVMLLILLLIYYVTHPLKIMIDISRDLVQLLSEDEEHRDYMPVMQKALFNLRRTDEVGSLACDFYHVVCLLHNKSVDKRKKAKYPANVFYYGVGLGDAKPLTFEALAKVWHHKDEDSKVAEADANVSYTVVARQSKDKKLDALDILESMAGDKDDEVDVRIASFSPPANPSAYQLVQSQPQDEEQGVKSTQIAHASPTICGTELQYIPITTSQPIGLVTSLKSQLAILSFLLLAGMILAMALTIATTSSEGQSWSTETGDEIKLQQYGTLQSIANIKAGFVKTHFQQMTLDLLEGGNYFAALMDGNLTTVSWEADGNYLPSYSIDPSNTYSKSQASPDYLFSGYYVSDDVGCGQSNTCGNTYNTNETRLTSLLDLKMESYFYRKSAVTFLQMAMEDDGFTRYWPYRLTSSNSNPTSCLVEITSSSLCSNLFSTSSCGNPNFNFYYPYESRCRSWYGVADMHNVAKEVYFQYPRLASDGSYVLTGVINVFPQNNPSNTKYAVLIANFLAQTLSDNINSLKILDTGYSFLLDRQNLTNVVIHPRSSNSCKTLQCTESLSTTETREFLNQLKNALSGGVIPHYSKSGGDWLAVTYPVTEGTIDYVLVLAVPNSEVLKASDDTNEAIDNATVTMIVVFVIVMAIFIASFVYVLKFLIMAMVDPINDLRSIMQLAINNDLSGEVPNTASSYDMALLLNAFSQLIIALRFGNESFAAGDLVRSRKVFEDAFNLYTALGNKRGQGAGLNNLAAVEFATGDLDKAISLYDKAIDMAKDHIKALSSSSISALDPVLRKAQHVYSDRQGNKALVLIEQEKYPEAYALLEEGLKYNKDIKYVQGCVVKNGTLGQLYLKQGEIKSAQRAFDAAIDFVKRQREDEAWAKNGWQVAELDAAEQIALFNQALLYQSKEKELTYNIQLEDLYLRALMTTRHVDPSTVTKILRCLSTIYASSPAHSQAVHLILDICKKQNISLANNGSQVKRMVFAVDYSGSMAGMKIRSAIDNLKDIFERYIINGDSLSVILFSNTVSTVLPMTEKSSKSESGVKTLIDTLDEPGGGTAFYDGVDVGLDLLAKSKNGDSTSDWVIALTDGEDNCSKLNKENLMAKLQRVKNVGLVIIGVGNDVATGALQSIANSCTKGFYLTAQADKESIREAFQQVAKVIQGQVLLEDF